MCMWTNRATTVNLRLDAPTNASPGIPATPNARPFELARDTYALEDQGNVSTARESLGNGERGTTIADLSVQNSFARWQL